jgi:hypothetical protein
MPFTPSIVHFLFSFSFGSWWGARRMQSPVMLGALILLVLPMLAAGATFNEPVASSNTAGWTPNGLISSSTGFFEATTLAFQATSPSAKFFERKYQFSVPASSVTLDLSVFFEVNIGSTVTIAFAINGQQALSFTYTPGSCTGNAGFVTQASGKVIQPRIVPFFSFFFFFLTKAFSIRFSVWKAQQHGHPKLSGAHNLHYPDGKLDYSHRY